MTKNLHNTTQIRCLMDYLRPVSDALSYDCYNYPERIVGLEWAKDMTDIVIDRDALEKELSEAVSMPETGEALSILYSYLASVVQDKASSFCFFYDGIYHYNEVALREGYQSERERYEEKITAQERIVDSLVVQVTELEHNDSPDSLCSARLDNRKARLQIEQDRLNDLYSRQSKLNEYLNIIDTTYKPAVDKITSQCRGLLPVAERYYKDWMSAHPAVDKPVRAKSSWDDCFSQDVITSDATKDYFNPGLIIRIYELCNGRQFEECNITSFIDAMNLRANGCVLKIKEREKVRVCHLINQLWRRLTKEVRDEWLSKMLVSLGISRKFYNSKYSISPREYDRSKASNTFCTELSEILTTAI